MKLFFNPSNIDFLFFSPWILLTTYPKYSILSYHEINVYYLYSILIDVGNNKEESNKVKHV